MIKNRDIQQLGINILIGIESASLFLKEQGPSKQGKILPENFTFEGL